MLDTACVSPLCHRCDRMPEKSGVRRERLDLGQGFKGPGPLRREDTGGGGVVVGGRNRSR